MNNDFYVVFVHLVDKGTVTCVWQRVVREGGDKGKPSIWKEELKKSKVMCGQADAWVQAYYSPTWYGFLQMIWMNEEKRRRSGPLQVGGSSVFDMTSFAHS